MDLKKLVLMANRTHEVCGWSGPGRFELDPDSEVKGSLIAYFEVNKRLIEESQDLLGPLQEIKAKVETIWGGHQKGVEFWDGNKAESGSGLIMAVWLDRGTPD